MLKRNASPPKRRRHDESPTTDHVDPTLAARYDSEQPLRPASAPNEETPHPRSISKPPTGLGAEPLNIVVLGASYAGLAVAHHFLDHTVQQLRITKAAPDYRLIIINPSTHLYWNVAAPRALVSPDLVANDDLFIPIEQGFHRHRGHHLSIVQGEAVALDTSARTVTVALIGAEAKKRMSVVNRRRSQVVSMVGPDAKVQTINYHALVMATGSTTDSDLLSLHSTHLHTMGALNAFHTRLATAKSIVVSGGGCSGVETAGQLATYLNYTSHWPFRRKVKQPKTITLISGSDRCLQPLKPKASLKAENLLKSLGVEIIHGVRVIAAMEDFDSTNQTRIELNNNTSIIADLYIPCTGVKPNTSYVTDTFKDKNGYIVTKASSLRIENPHAGERVYAIGDCASYSQNNLVDVYAAVPVLMQNLLNDLLAHEYTLASPYGSNQDKIDALEDEAYVPGQSDVRLCPISRFGGVGVLRSGMVVSGLVVHALKGKDCWVGKGRRVVGEGRGPGSYGGGKKKRKDDGGWLDGVIGTGCK